MERRHQANPAVLCLVLVMLFLLGCSVRIKAAEVKVNHIGYVDSVGRLVLKYEDFSKKGYTWQVYQKKVCVKKGRQVSGAKTLAVNLGDKYTKDTIYKLVLCGRGKENKRKLTVYYFTGKYLNNFMINQSSSGSLNFRWNNGEDSLYQVFAVGLTSDPAAAAFDIQVRTDSSKSSIDIPGTKLATGTYQVHLISLLNHKGKAVFGEGVVIPYDYATEPGQVIGVNSVVNADSVTLSWNAVSDASGYNVSQQTDTGAYVDIASNQQGTSITIPKLTGGKIYRFKVAAVNAAGTKVSVGKDAIVQVTMPKIASAPQKLLLDLDKSGSIKIRWSTVPDADFYHLYFKTTDMDDYRLFGTTKETEKVLKNLSPDSRYAIKVFACTKSQGQVYESLTSSPVKTFVPSQYMGKNQWKMLALKVRSVHYGKSRVTYTTKKYPKEVRLAFVHYKKYKSKTKYLIWVSLYTQQCNIFEGEKGNWKLIRSFDIASGTAENRTPTGTYQIQYKEKGWYYNYTKELYVSHYKGRNAFHTRPLYNDGSVCSPAIGRPVSHGCIRCYNEDARFIYEECPVGTTVVMY